MRSACVSQQFASSRAKINVAFDFDTEMIAYR